MIENILLNKELQWIGRCIDMICLGFGRTLYVKNYKNEIEEQNEFDLHIQCPFRMIKDKEIILSSRDVYIVPGDPDSDEWDEHDNNLYDITVNEKISKMLPLKIKNVVCNDVGDIFIALEKNIMINIFAISSEEVEDWRFINHNTGEHYVWREEDDDSDA